MSGGIRLGELAERVGGRVVGDSDAVIDGVATLEQAGPDQLSFLSNPRYRDAARRTRAGAILVKPGSGIDGPALLEVDEPYLALAKILGLFHTDQPAVREVSSLAHIGRDVRLGKEVAVEPFAFIGDGVDLGDGVTVGAGSVVGAECRVGRGFDPDAACRALSRHRVGRDCLIHAGVVLGGDGFGFATSGGAHHKVPQLGRVVIEDDVEIGANTTVDRGDARRDRDRGGQQDRQSGDDRPRRAARARAACWPAQTGIAGSTRSGERDLRRTVGRGGPPGDRRRHRGGRQVGGLRRSARRGLRRRDSRGGPPALETLAGVAETAARAAARDPRVCDGALEQLEAAPGRTTRRTEH